VALRAVASMCTLGPLMADTIAGALVDVVSRHGAPEQANWVLEASEGLGAPPAPTKLRIVIARAARKLGDAVPSLSEAERAALPPGPAYDRWVLRDFGRAALVLLACERLDADAQVPFIEPLVRRGEIGEQVSLLRMAVLLPGPERFVDVIVDACRTNSLDVFEAIACENPYVRDHFPEANFNQVVLKSMFMEVAVDRIVGLAERVNAELVRMAEDFGDERRAAGRTVPEDIERIKHLAQTKAEA